MHKKEWVVLILLALHVFWAIDVTDQQSIFDSEQNARFYDTCHKSDSLAVISNPSFKYCQHHLELKKKKKEQLITMPIEQKNAVWFKYL